MSQGYTVMDSLLYLLYYGTVAIVLCVYMRKRTKGLSISDFIVLGVTVLFSIAGYFIAYGKPLGYDELDAELYAMYLLFAVLVPVGLLVGKRIQIAGKSSDCGNGISDRILIIMMVLVIIYAIGYFIIIKDNIPLIMLLTGKGAGAVKVARLQVTHNFDSFYQVPFIYRYRGLVFNYVSMYLFCAIMVKYFENKKKYRVGFWGYAVFEFFLQFYATEKVPLIYLLMVTIFVYYLMKYQFMSTEQHEGNYSKKEKLKKKQIRKRIRMFIVVGGVFFFILYIGFMGIQQYKKGFQSLVSRVFVSQSSEVYLQKKMLDLKYEGCLNGTGIPLTIIDSLTGRETVNLSREVYKTLYVAYTSAGGGGTSGSIAIFEYFANFGMLIAIFVVFTVALITGVIDKRMRNKVAQVRNKELNITNYAMLLLIFFQGYLGHFQTFLTFPFLISPQLIIVFVLNLVFKSFK